MALGTVFHYAVVDPYDNHELCSAQVAGLISFHENHGYKTGGAYNGHFCQHGGIWVSYWGPNQATGDTWANLNLNAWCWLGAPGYEPTPAAYQAAYDLTVSDPHGRDQIYPHSAFVATACCGDPLRDWIAAGALAPTIPVVEEDDEVKFLRNSASQVFVTDGITKRYISPTEWDGLWARINPPLVDGEDAAIGAIPDYVAPVGTIGGSALTYNIIGKATPDG